MTETQAVFFHGAGLSGTSWSGWGGMALDLPGHGAAPRVKVPSVESFADALEPCLPEFMHLIGHSLGGMVAVELAARLQERVRSLVTIEAVPTVQLSRLSRLGAGLAMRLFNLIGPRGVALLSGLGQSRKAAAHIRPQIGAMNPKGMADALHAAFEYDARPKLNQITAPTLVLVGSDNKQTHSGARFMAHRIPNATYDVLKGGHILHVDANDALLERLIQFHESSP
ncbi:MAG: alpha/beta fold hydrolase [Paracoccaceae bacterium]